MELPETLEVLNKRLADRYGIDTASSKAMWRVVFGDDEFEVRYGEYEDITPSGVYLRTVKEFRTVPKYRQWAPHMYVLERLVAVPGFQVHELGGQLVSYEPLWTFRDKNDNPLPPIWEAIELIVCVVLSVQHKDNRFLRRYYNPEGENSEEVLNQQKERIDRIIDELWGEQSSLGGKTYATGEAIVVPNSYKKKEGVH